MPAADGLSADMAHKAHVKALNRDYILEPRLGEECKKNSLNAWDSCLAFLARQHP